MANGDIVVIGIIGGLEQREVNNPGKCEIVRFQKPCPACQFDASGAEQQL
jgi:hypothetical protein